MTGQGGSGECRREAPVGEHLGGAAGGLDLGGIDRGGDMGSDLELKGAAERVCLLMDWTWV